jgi:CheY-like chemotaxis protein
LARILIADDNHDARALLRKALERLRHEIVEAPDGGVALRLARRAPVDLFFCDVFMPNMDGIEAMREFRASFPGVPVVIMSGDTCTGWMEMLSIARKLGASDLLLKPFRPDSLARCSASCSTASEARAGPRACQGRCQ